MARRQPRNRNRTVITPEGVALPLVLASRGSRAAALFIDLILIVTAMTVTTLTLIWIAGGVGIKIGEVDADGPKSRAVQALAIVWIIAMFLFRNAWFLFFELGPRGATPGKRVTGIRIAARGTERLTTEAVIARNIVRDIELFMPIVFISSAIASGSDTDVAGWAGAIWCAIFLLFPFFNRDSLRCGDVIAGTWVVEAQNRKLGQALSVSAPAAAADQAFTFTSAELAVYGEYELQTLERVLREDKGSALDDVADAISRKIGRPYPYRAERVFLESYYIQLRAQLEQGLRLGRRKADKYAA
ncbi:RDD family protein [Novosphingobium sp.]|uniref:RDD family protein n=1 Tax=Novosphingobium sp. TaxID=1874826 RepID=UPI002623E841|nr:RDD family protein [Novosphingobium sp.]